MIEVHGDIFGGIKSNWKAITVHGSVNSNGENALTSITGQRAKQYYISTIRNAQLPYNLSKIIGTRIRTSGNKLHIFEDLKLVTIPIKHKSRERYSNIDLICKSLDELVKFIEEKNFIKYEKTIAIPYLGCGTGQFDKKEMIKVLSLLPDSVILANYQEHKSLTGLPNIIISQYSDRNTRSIYGKFYDIVNSKNPNSIITRRSVVNECFARDLYNSVNIVNKRRVVQVYTHFSDTIKRRLAQNIELAYYGDILLINWDGEYPIDKHLIKTCKEKGLIIREFIKGKEQ